MTTVRTTPATPNLAEVEHRSERVDTTVYLRENGEGFGLGQINGSEASTRKIGADETYRVTDNLNLRSQIYRQSNLATEADRNLLEAETRYQQWTINPQWSLNGGIEQSINISSKTATPVNVNVPPASGPENSDDFTATSLGATYRSPSEWIWTGRAEYRNAATEDKLQTSLQYGAKFVRETIDDISYEGYTDLVGLESRYDITKNWDIGLRASVLHAWELNQYDYSYGASIGHSFIKNIWISAGYNFAGFRDEDFSGDRYSSKGPFVQFRMKFDQQSVREVVSWVSR